MIILSKCMKKSFIYLIIPILLTSCIQNNNKYKIRVLNQLKSSSEFYNFQDFTTRVWVSDYLHLTLKYDSIKNDIIVSEIWNTRDNKKEEVTSFLNEFISTYFLISNEKMHSNFPVESVNTYKCSFPSKLIAIEKFESENDRNEKNYHLFRYLYADGFLFLQTYCYYTNGYFDSSGEKITLNYK